MSAEPLIPQPAGSLYERLRAADAAALAEVFHAHGPVLLRTAHAMTGSIQDAEDIVQDLFVGLSDAIAKFDGTGSLEGWLRRVVVRMALMRLRAARRRREDDASGAEATAGADRIESTLADRLTIAQALRALPDELRVIVVLKDIEGRSHGEIARLLGIRPNTAAVRLHRARAVLRQLLKEDR